MSFSRANIKRFNESKGCAPPPGAYDPKQMEKAHGGIVDKSERFKNPKEVSAAGVNVSTVSNGKTPVKQLFAAPQSGKKMPPPADCGKIKELEREIRRLLKEHGDKDKLLTQKDADIKKQEGLTFKETSRLKDEVSQALSQMLADLQKLDSFVITLENNVSSYNELLKTVTGGHDTEKKPLPKRKDEGIPMEELAQKLKDEKLLFDNKLKQMRRKYENLQQRFSRAIEDFNNSTKTLKVKYTSVMEENAKLQEQMSAVHTQLQEAVKVRTSLEEQRDNLLDSNGCLQDQVKQMSSEQTNTTENLRILTANMEELQAGTVVLQQQLVDLQHIHDTTCRETSDKLHSLEMREVLVNETTANLHERIVELQAQNEDLAAALKETGELLGRTRDENDKLEEMLKQTQVSWEAEKKHLLIQVEELVFEKSKAESELGDVEVRVRELETEIENNKTQSNDQIDALANQLDVEKAELIQLQNKLGDLVYEKSQLHVEVGHLEAQLKLVKSESEDTVTEANKAMEVIPELRMRIETLNTEKADSEKRAFELSEQNETLQCTLEKFQADFDEHYKKVDTERHETQAKIIALTEEIEGLKEQKDQMAKELDDWLTDKSELDIEIAKLQCRIKVLEMENDQMKEESEKEIESCKSDIDRVQKEKQQIEKDMEQYGIDLLSNAAQLQSLQTKLDSVTADVEKLETENKALKESQEYATADVVKLETENKTLKERLECAIGDVEKLETTNRTLKESLEQKETLTAEKESQLVASQLSYDRKCAECEELFNDKEKLSEDLRVQRENYEDLECRLQQTRADFIKRCDERDELMKNNEAKDKSLAMLSEQVTQLTQELETVNVSLKTRNAEYDEMVEKQCEYEKRLTLATQQVSNYKQEIEDYKEHLQLKCEECDELQLKCDDYDIEMSMTAREIVDLQERADILRKETIAAEEVRGEVVEKYEREIEELKAQLEGASGNDDLLAQIEKYKAMYEDLQAKVEPFMEQIDAFEMEKQLLLGKNKDTQAEMERLGRNYAQLLGHQNQKQKIKHIVKIKDENNELKRENQTLKEQTAKQKRQIQKLEEKMAPKRFDPSKAFHRSKENLNATVTKSPLRDLNRK